MKKFQPISISLTMNAKKGLAEASPFFIRPFGLDAYLSIFWMA